MKSLHEHGLPVAFVLVWSSAYVAGAVATAVAPPLTVTLWRFVIAAVLLAGFAWRRRERWPRPGRELLLAIITGVLLFAVQFGGLYLGMAAHMPAATTALIACSAPLVVAIASAALGWERLAGRQWAGAALGVAGVVITLGDRVGRPPSAAALGWTLLGLVGLVAGTILQGRARFAAGASALAAVEQGAGALAMAVCAPFMGTLALPFTGPFLLSFGWLAIVAGVGGPLMLFALIRKHGATRASSVLFVVPALTALAAWLVLGTPIGPTALVGFGVAGTGLWLARKQPAAQQRDTSASTSIRHATPSRA